MILGVVFDSTFIVMLGIFYYYCTRLFVIVVGIVIGSINACIIFFFVTNVFL